MSVVRSGLPIWMGAATQRILQAASFYSMGLDVPVAGHLEHGVTIQIGLFRVTPFLNDAFDQLYDTVDVQPDGVWWDV